MTISKRHIGAGLIIFALVAFGVIGLRQSSGTEARPVGTLQEKQSSVSNKPAEQSDPVTPPKFDKSVYSIDDPASIWVVANKLRPLTPAAYAPSDLTVPNVALRSNITSDERQLRTEPARALEQMFAAAKAQGIELTVQSGYRSYNFQDNLYRRYVSVQGQAVADTQSARPGHSEHQTGLAVDVGGITRPACNVETCYEETPEGKWVAQHAHEYGFVIRYAKGATPTTGYIYEPWHLRYVGAELAGELAKQGMPTLETFFGLPPAPDYN